MDTFWVLDRFGCLLKNSNVWTVIQMISCGALLQLCSSVKSMLTLFGGIKHVWGEDTFLSFTYAFGEHFRVILHVSDKVLGVGIYCNKLSVQLKKYLFAEDDINRINSFH